MPARQVTESFRAPPLAVVGSYGKTTTVCHVGLLVDATELSAGCEVAVYDIGPPLHLEATDGTTKAHVIGWPEGLSDSQRKGMADWLQDKRTWLATQPAIPNEPGPERFRDYTVHQASIRIRDVNTGREIYRYSCVGFVDSCYAEGAQLHLIDHQSIPTITFTELREIWPQVNAFREPRWANRAKLKPEEARLLAVQCGLDNEGPWPILLPGYLLHSLARADLAEPYKPKLDDHLFPSSADGKSGTL